jgi:hypothetical protein
MGMDRLAMLMTNNASIQDVLFFPQMKPETKAKSGEAADAGALTGEKSESGSDETASAKATNNRSGESEVPPQTLRSHSEAAADEIDRDPELTDEEKLVMKLLHEQSPAELNELKGKTGLSNKKWDLALKGLRKHDLATVEKNEEGLFVALV